MKLRLPADFVLLSTVYYRHRDGIAIAIAIPIVAMMGYQIYQLLGMI